MFAHSLFRIQNSEIRIFKLKWNFVLTNVNGSNVSQDGGLSYFSLSFFSFLFDQEVP